MLTQKHTTEMVESMPTQTRMASTTLRTNLPNLTEPAPPVLPDAPATRIFDHIARTTLAERFPLLTCFAISFALLASALITEIECLKGSGYFWR